ncbi:MAG: prepilin-type N-terminal cleavage/methylation domain-containing protein [Syntrophaceticus schinkii]
MASAVKVSRLMHRGPGEYGGVSCLEGGKVENEEGRPLKKQHGFTMVELVIALTLLLLVALSFCSHVRLYQCGVTEQQGTPHCIEAGVQ